jgi:hypothetical protein
MTFAQQEWLNKYLIKPQFSDNMGNSGILEFWGQYTYLKSGEFWVQYTYLKSGIYQQFE